MERELRSRRARHAATLACVALALVGCGSDTSGGDRKGGGGTSGGGGAGTSGGSDLCVADADGDGIGDGSEGSGDTDTDSDGTPDSEDSDSDGDGIDDTIELGRGTCASPADSDQDGTPDFRDLDSDGDGTPDAEGDPNLDTDMDGVPDYADRDDDGDTLLDVEEFGDDPTNPRDSDEDGVPDYQDPDSDNDGIRDGAIPVGVDTDGDKIPDYRDPDDDGDGISDEIEVGDDPAMPRDADGDGTPDHQDADSDDDGIADIAEDKNGNGKVDAGETDPLEGDTDMDGASDLIESAAGTDPTDGTANPQADGNFVFVVPYKKDPMPPDATLDFTTDIVKADVFFSVDTTGSMGGEILQLQMALSGTIIPNLAASIPDLGYGVGSFRDFPVGGFGSPGVDLPFVLGAAVTTDPMVAQTAVNALAATGGGDGPESGVEALYQIATGAGVMWPGGSIPAQMIGWRAGALPIVVQITDANVHDAATYGAMVPMAASRMQAKDALAAIRARVIGVGSQGGTGPEADLLDFINATGAIVPTDAFGAGGQCLTGLNGAAVAPTGGMCPLLFAVDAGGMGLGGTIVDGVKALINFAGLDIDARPENETGNKDARGDDVNAVKAFLDRVEPNPSPPAATGCVKGLATEDRLEMDGVDDTFLDVKPGSKVCFDVIAKMNKTVEPDVKPQMFKARIDVVGDGVTTLDSRQVWFLVPPVPPKPGDPPPVE
jgi:hypothetical protein